MDTTFKYMKIAANTTSEIDLDFKPIKSITISNASEPMIPARFSLYILQGETKVYLYKELNIPSSVSLELEAGDLDLVSYPSWTLHIQSHLANTELHLSIRQ